MPKDDDTLLDTTSPRAPRTSGEIAVDSRYDLGSVLGRGGMGEVRNARDLRFQRDVAVKLLRTAASDADTRARFLREAQVQGRLEHPAIPPVHDLGNDSDGQPYFVMKKLAGWTLYEVLEARSSSDALATKFSRRQLLSRLVDVCMAIEFAHARGIVHRDLKPANIMLGEYGETYVLDWGLARVNGDELPLGAANHIEVGLTAVGALLGTPGYMAPEQARGEEIDARVDVFSLGCILYEILTGTQALPRGMAAIEPTLATPEHRPSRRVDVPPELDELCARATAQDRTKRPTARQLAEGIQAYLDGDRDVARRKELATEHVERAHRALEKSDEAARAEAMREASRAHVLDATNTAAADILATLVLAAPDDIPAAARAEADHARGVSRQKMFRWAAVTYGIVVLLMVGLLFTFPVKRMWPLATSSALCAALAAMFLVLSRKPMPMRSPKFILVLAMNTLLLGMSAFIFGPLLITPIFIVGSLAGYVIAPSGYSPLPVVATHVIAFLVPVALELAGVTPSTFDVQHGSLVLTPYAIEMTSTTAVLFMIIAVLSQFVNSTLVGYSERLTQEVALDRVHAQSWHFKQILPAGDARAEPAAPDPRRAPPSASA